MVLTDLPFARPSVIESRYALINQSNEKVSEDEDGENKNSSKEYAKFLKDQQKMFGVPGEGSKSGFITTARFERSAKKPVSVVDVAISAEADRKKFENQMKIIADHMWKHKQEERELKRVEGDILKNQRMVRRSMRDYQQSINKKWWEEEKRLSKSLDKYTKVQQDHTHAKEELNKQRIEKVQTTEQGNKDKERKVFLATSNLARKFRSKADELGLKEVEADRLVREFQHKLKLREEEQFKLKQELADLAIELNMEAQKGREMKSDAAKDKKKSNQMKIEDDKTVDKDLDNKLGKSDSDVKVADTTKRRLSANLERMKSKTSMKTREEGRHMLDTRVKLNDNRSVQRQLNITAMEAEQDLKTKEINNKIQMTETRKKNKLSKMMREKKEKEISQQIVFEDRFKRRMIEQKKREHEDHLKHFQKTVKKDEDVEHDLFNKVRNTEYNRQKQEQVVRHLQSQLASLKRENALKLKQEMIERSNNEKDIHQKLQREQAELAKMHAQREDSYQTLMKHRALMEEERHLLNEHEREHARLIRVGQRSDSQTE
ncbi:uncharacterized protein LOC141903151 [Tubulanus polymorphus]|uniref:uncharacterized protein LOC141903151 n=1 Tax=Tubulanus polymorphus TaxID=672921 RepID=UPI003DA47742